MDGGMNLNGIGIPLGETFHRGAAAMRGAIIGDPKDPICRTVRLLLHDVIDQVVIGVNPARVSAQAEEFSPVHVPSGEVGQCALALVFELPATRATGARWTPGGPSCVAPGYWFSRPR